jgi:hypothetical protein
MAIGQIADYRRFTDPKARAGVLVPEAPRSDLLALLESEGIAAIWPNDTRSRWLSLPLRVRTL